MIYTTHFPVRVVTLPKGIVPITPTHSPNADRWSLRQGLSRSMVVAGYGNTAGGGGGTTPVPTPVPVPVPVPVGLATSGQLFPYGYQFTDEPGIQVPVPAPLPDPVPYLYYRIHVTATNSSDPYKLAISEFKLSAVADGPNVLTGGTPVASSTFGGANAPEYAFDNNDLTHFATATDAPLPQWVGYQLPEAKLAAEYTIVSGDNTARAARAPLAWQLQGSNNGVT